MPSNANVLAGQSGEPSPRGFPLPAENRLARPGKDHEQVGDLPYSLMYPATTSLIDKLLLIMIPRAWMASMGFL